MTTTTESVRVTKIKPVERVFARIYIATSQLNLTGNAWNKILINTIDQDLGLNFVVATNRIVIPVTGLYEIIGAVTFTGVIATKRYLMAIYKNGSVIRKSSNQSSLIADITCQCSDRFFLKKNDYIELYGYPEVGGGTDTVDVDGGIDDTILLVRLINKEGIRQ